MMSNTHLDALLDGQPQEIQEEIIRINTEARPIALQIALLIPLLAALIGLFNAFRMTRLPDPKPSAAAEIVTRRQARALTRCRRSVVAADHVSDDSTRNRAPRVRAGSVGGPPDAPGRACGGLVRRRRGRRAPGATEVVQQRWTRPEQ